MKVAIIGIGNVESSLGLALVGRQQDVAVGEPLDLLHASGFGHPPDVSAGDTGDSDVTANPLDLMTTPPGDIFRLGQTRIKNPRKLAIDIKSRLQPASA